MVDFEGGKHSDFDLDNAIEDSVDPSSNRLQNTGASYSPGTLIVSADANGAVTLPAGVSLEDITVQGRDLVINLADGSTIVIPDGAIIVPQIIIDGLAVPPLDLAALLNGIDPQAGPQAPGSSGGNFAGDEGAIQDAFDLGNLLPYTELGLPVVQEEEVIPDIVDRDPDVVIETPDNPIGVENAIATVNETGLPARGGEGASEPPGVGENADGNGSNDSNTSETTSGTIVFDAPDGLSSIIMNGTPITSVGQTFTTIFGTLTITSIDLPNGMIGFSYTLADNLLGETADGNFFVTVVDLDGDEASATLNVIVIDDSPLAADDIGIVPAATFGPISGNVLDNDQSGADDYPEGEEGPDAVTGFSNAGGSADPGESLQGDYGVLTLNADGSYSYTRDFNTPGGVEDSFDYTIVDQDDSTSTATLVIQIGNAGGNVIAPTIGEGTVVNESGLPERVDPVEPEGTQEGTDGETTSGTITFMSPDGLKSITIAGVTVNLDNDPSDSSDDQVIVDDATGTFIVTGVTYDPATGEGTIDYTFTLGDNTSGDNTQIPFVIVVTDLDDDPATDTLIIKIIDDEPFANADEDSVAEGSIADGNVFTGSGGSDANETDGVADVIGADGAAANGPVVDADFVSGSQGIALVSKSVAPDGTITIVTSVGTLTLGANGTYSFASTANSINADAQVVFSYTIEDGDGDQATANLTIDIDNVGGSATAGDLTVDEKGLADGTGELTDPDPQTDLSEIDSGNIVVTGGSGTLTYKLVGGVFDDNGTPGDASDDTYSITTAYGTIVLNAATGAYTYTLNEEYDHAAPPPNTAVRNTAPDVESFDYVVVDEFDNVVVDSRDPGGDPIKVSIVDDIPEVDIGTTGENPEALLTFDEQTVSGTSTDTADFSTAFDVDSFEFGADGAGDLDTTYALVFDAAFSEGDPSGLFSDGAAIYLYQLANGTIVGSTANSEPGGIDASVVFSLSINTDTGVVTLTQYAELDHSASEDAPAYDDDIISLASDLIEVEATATIIDNDGDTVTDSATVDLGNFVNFADDGPHAVISASGVSVTHDETPGEDGDADDVAGPLTVFDNVDNVGDDLDVAGTGPIGLAVSTTGLSSAGSDNGADGAGTTTFSLALSSDTGVDSGLDITGGGDIILFKEGDLVVGRVGDENGVAAFAIAIDATTGEISVVQYLSIEHGDDSDHDDPESINADVLFGVVTVTDEEGDSDDASVSIGELITFEDDGPAISQNGEPVGELILDESLEDPDGDGIVSDQADFSGNFDADFGADGAGSPDLGYEFLLNGLASGDPGADTVSIGSGLYALDASDTEDVGDDSDGIGQGDEIMLEFDGDDIVGMANGTEYFRISVDSDGMVTFSQTNNIWHGNTGDDDDAETLTTDTANLLQLQATATDGDDDTATATINLGAGVFKIEDDGPNTDTNGAVQLDDDAVSGANGNPGDNGDGSDDADAVNVTGFLSHEFGTDGAGSIDFAAMHGESVVLNGVTVTFTWAGDTLTANDGSKDVFKVQITDPTTGAYTVTQLAPLDHHTNALADDTETDASFDLTYTVTDADGDTETGTLTVNIDDDTPTAQDDTFTQQQADENMAVNGDVSTNDSPGADGLGAYTFNNDADNDGVDVSANLSFDPDGSFTYTPSAGEEGTVTFTYTLTDGDGDSVTKQVTINLADDSDPSAAGDTIAVDDDGLADANLTGTPTDDVNANADDANAGELGDTEAISIGNLNGSFGNDTPGSYTFDDGSGTLGTEAIDWTWDDVTDTLTASSAGRGTIFTIVVDQATGDYTLTLFKPVLHEPPTDDATNGEFTASLDLTYNAVDSESEVSPNATLTITFGDDGPTFASNSTAAPDLVTDDTDVEANGTDSASASFASLFTPEYGADGQASSNPITYALGVGNSNSGLTDAETDQAILLRVKVGDPNTIEGYLATDGDIAFTITVNPDTGLVTLTQNRAITHDDPADADELYDVDPLLSAAETMAAGAITLTAKITDGDGDYATSTVNIGNSFHFEDDGPNAKPDEFTQGSEDDPVVGNVLVDNGFGLDEVGADSPGTVSEVPGSLTGTGSLNLSSNGDFTYTPGAGEEGDVTFQYTLTDADGDESVATVTIKLLNDSLPSLSVTDGTVDEQGLPMGTGELADGNGANDSDKSETTVGTFTIQTFGDGLGALEVQNKNGLWIDVTGATVGTPITVTGVNGILSVTSDGVGNYSWSYTLTNNLSHPDNDPDDGDGIEGLADPLPGDSFAVRVTDTDNDTTTVTASTTIDITVLDDAPVIKSVTDPLEINNDSNPSGSGNFAFLVGADQNSDFDDIDVTNFSVTVNNSAATLNYFTAGAETATTASYTFSFSYPTGTTGTGTNTGTLVFHKDTGTYDVTLDGPVKGFTIDATSDPDTTFVEINPNVTIAQLDTDFFAQFTGIAEPGSGTGANNLHTKIYDPDITDTNTGAWVAGELFDQAAATVQVSSTAAGVGGNTIQGGEVLDFNLYSSDPGAATGTLSTASATDMFLKFDTVGSSEDMIIVLKLWNDTNGNGEIDAGDDFTTRALMIENGDILRSGDTIPDLYSSITLDNNDGLVIIESNDYNTAIETWQIVGAQIAGSDEGITGSAINFNPDTGVSGGSNVGNLSTYQDFSTDVDNGPFKITSIGFVRPNTTDQTATLEFDVTITDSDGDSVTQSDVTVTFGNFPSAPVILDLNGDAADFTSIASSNVAYDYDGDGVKTKTAWIAAGAAILAYDANNDNAVTDASEFVFGHDGMTDLEALAAEYDSNGDGKLDASDSTYGKFGVWLDDGDGVSEAGEFVSLSDAGISSIELVSDGNAFGAADGDVTVFGTASFTMEDGTTGNVYDASFATGGDVDGTMEALMAMAAADGGSDGSEDTGTQTTQDEADVTLVLDDAMAGSTIDALIDHYADDPGDAPALADAGGYLGDATLTLSIDGGAFAFESSTVVDSSEEAAALAAAHA